MNIGSLYTVKKYFWLLFSTKDATAAAARSALAPAAAAAWITATAPAAHAAYWSKRFNCEVTYFTPDSYIVFLEEDGKLKKVLTSEGKIGWIWFNKDYISCFEEVKTEP